MQTTPAHDFMFVSEHYVDNVRNVKLKTNRGGITGHIHVYCLSHFLACIFILYVYFIVQSVPVFFCMQINK